MTSTALEAIPVRWCGDPTDQLRTLKDEIVRQIDFPTAEASAFMARAFDALQQIQEVSPSSDVALCLMAIGRSYYLNGQPERAVQASAAAVIVATSTRQRGLEAKARLAHGTNLRDANELFESLNELSLALELFRDEGDAVMEAKVLNNLGNWHTHVGLCAEAREIFQRIAEYFLTTGDRVSAWMALDNAAVAALKLGDIERGINLACKASETWSGEAHTAQEILWVVQGMLTYCELLLEAGRADEAAACAHTARVVATRSNSTRTASLAEMACAVADFSTGRAGTGAIDIAIERARKISSHYHGAALETAIRAYERADHLDKALALQQELIALSAKQKFESMRRALGRPSPDETHGLAKLIQLGTSVDRRVSELINTAVTQALRAGHDHARIFRVSRLAELFTESEKWPPERVRSVALSARLIDIGMMVIPDAILSKRRSLEMGERKLIEEHTRFGAEVLVRTRLALLEPCIPVVRFHHERWDGTGSGSLGGDDIPIEARVVALCDAFDALMHERPWRHALSISAALRTLELETGTKFDPNLSNRFVLWVQGELRMNDDFEARLAAEALENDYVRTRGRLRQLIRPVA